MEKVSYHTHSNISDGELSPRELIELAIKKGFKILAITDHYPRPKGIESNNWSNGFYTDEHYAELKKLQKEYESKIKVLVGAEFEWYPKHKKWIANEVKRRAYDIKIISIHQIFINGKYYTINYLEKEKGNILDAFGNNVKKVINCYYGTLRDAISSGLFDVVGHLDLIKTLEDGTRYFSEDEEWYRKEVFETLKLIKKVGIKMEVNLQGFSKALNEQWPSKWIIDEANKMGIELLVGTDAHNELQLDYDVVKVENLLK